MALSGDTVGLIFKLSADSKQAQAEFKQLKQVVGTESKAIADIFTGNLSGALDQIVKGFTRLGSSATASISATTLAVGGLAAGIGALLAGILVAAKKTSDLGFEIEKLHQKTGLAADTLSGLNVALGLEGKGLDAVSSSLVRFDAARVKAQQGNKDLASIFRQLGDDLKGPVDEGFRKVYNGLANTEVGANRTAASLKLFGRGGAEVLTAMNSLEGGIDGAIKRAKELGLFFDNEGAASAAAYKNQILELNQQMEGLQVRIGNVAIPALTNFTVIINQAAKAMGALFDKTHSWVEEMEKLGALAKLAGTGADLSIVFDAMNGIHRGGDNGGNDINFPVKTPKGDKAADAALRRLEIQRKEEIKIEKSAQEEIKREHELRLSEEFEFSQKLIAEQNERLEVQTVILDKEEKVVKNSKFDPEKKKTELEKINAERKDLERDVADEIEKINDDLEKRLEKIGIEREQAEFKVLQESLKRKKEAIDGALADQLIKNEEAERELTEFTRQEILGRIALANAELDRTRENLQLRQVALEKLKALELELAAAAEEGERRIHQARLKDIEDLIRIAEEQRKRREAELQKQGFGPEEASAIAGIEALLRRTLTLREQLNTSLKGIISDARATLPTLGQVFVQTTNIIAKSLSDMITAFLSGQATLRQAVAAFYAAALAPLKNYLLKKATIQFALGIADLADLNFAGAAKHFLAGTALSAAAGLIGLGGTLIAGTGAGGTVGPSTSPGGQPLPSGTRTIDQGAPIPGQRPGGPPIIIIHAKQAPGVVVDIVAQDFKNNGEIRKIIRRDAEVGG